MSVEATLQKVPLFSQLAPADLQRVLEVARERTYPKNSVILFEDDPGDALYVVRQGQVKVVLIGEDGREVILSVLGEGDFFGEMALIDDEPRSAHVIAMGDSTLLVLRREDFQGLLMQTPGIALAMLRDGLLERFPFEEIYGLHNMPGHPVGHVDCVRAGTFGD